MEYTKNKIDERYEHYRAYEDIMRRNDPPRMPQAFMQSNRSALPVLPAPSRVATQQAALSPTFQYLSGPIVPKPDAVPSPLEAMYSERIVDELTQFGYDLFDRMPPPANYTQPQDEDNAAPYRPSYRPPGAVPNDYVISMGDRLEVVFTGQRNDRETYTVNQSGQLIIDDFAPIPAAGRTMGQLRAALNAAASEMHNTQAYVSLAEVAQIGVLVVGHVNKPGRKVLTVFHTALDALMEAGGVQKTGSLRQIKLVRDGRSMIVDLYGLLIHGAGTTDLQLRNGDRLIVPPLGPTVAIAGEVKRPGIYEINPALSGMHHRPNQRSEAVSLNDMLEMGGGVMAPGNNRYMKLSLMPGGEEQVQEVDNAFLPMFKDGSVLMVSKGRAKRAGTVELAGHTRNPGIFALAEKKTLAGLLTDETMVGEDIYPLIGVIERWDPEQLAARYSEFPLRLVLSGDFDQTLKDGDIVHLFSKAQIMNLPENNPDPMPLEIAQGSRTAGESDYIEDAALVSFLSERAAYMRGAVRKPGAYPVADGITLDNLVAVAGGLALEANVQNIELTSKTGASGASDREVINTRETNPETVLVSAGDAVRVNQRFQKVAENSVLIMGAVANPGRYDLMPGDKISDLIDRAGGPTAQAYPEGAIFSRASERKAEEARFRAQARDIRGSIAAALEADDEKVGAGKIAEAMALASELEDAQGVGRITVEADIGVLLANPELDMLLQNDDRLYIPQRSLNVRVSGEVLSPANLQFRQDKRSLDYIHEAGGFTYHADKDRTFVLYPDGSAQPLKVSSWNYNPVFIPPGSTVVVPRDPKPFDFIQSAKDVSQILTNLAITAIFIDDVKDDDL